MKNFQILNYKIIISEYELDNWLRFLQEENESLAPEIIGMLLGRATPIIEPTREEVNINMNDEPNTNDPVAGPGEPTTPTTPEQGDKNETETPSSEGDTTAADNGDNPPSAA